MYILYKTYKKYIFYNFKKMVLKNICICKINHEQVIKN